MIGAKLWVDEDYDSGIEGCPGARFVVDLNTPLDCSCHQRQVFLPTYSSRKMRNAPRSKKVDGTSVFMVIVDEKDWSQIRLPGLVNCATKRKYFIRNSS